MRNLNGFGETLLKEVLPQVEKTYKVQADRDARAIAGLSMGGGESLVVALIIWIALRGLADLVRAG